VADAVPESVRRTVPAETDGSGSASLAAFRGENPDRGAGWGCYASGDPVPAGVAGLTTCFVRLASSDPGSAVAPLSLPFTIVDEAVVLDPVVPEAPFVALLAVLAVIAVIAVIAGVSAVAVARLRSHQCRAVATN